MVSVNNMVKHFNMFKLTLDNFLIDHKLGLYDCVYTQRTLNHEILFL